MIVSDVKVPVRHSEADLIRAIKKAAKKKDLRIRSVRILKRSIDARKKPDLFYVMKLAVNEPEPAVEKRPESLITGRNVVIGAGPAGLFAARTLAEAGKEVILLERGKCVEERSKDVERFFETGVLDPEDNVQFGEGGAGTFSDGKLNTLTVDKSGLNGRVLQIFTDAGADESIRYDQRPHIGTDKLKGIVTTIRRDIEKMGGEVRFSAKVERIRTEDGAVTGVELANGEVIPTERVILAIGHSARDTFYMLKDLGVQMEAKPFAVGVRMEHPQAMITMDQYGTPDYEELGAAPYKVTAKTAGGRGVYSFCMCPGGYVVNASSEPGKLCINGMSYSGRDGENANAAIVVQVTPDDYPSDDPLAGVEFQRALEKKAFDACVGKIPVQLYEDYDANRLSDGFGDVHPQMKGAYGFGNVNDILPEPLNAALKEAIPKFGRMIKGYDRPDALISAVEARTSSPVRIVRNEHGESNIRGLYPCGEGAGYAGGITSAAMDGIRIAEYILYQENEHDSE